MLSEIAFVQWTESRDAHAGSRRVQTARVQDQHTEIVRYFDSQVIFDDVFIQLWGNGRDSQELAAGKYEFPF